MNLSWEATLLNVIILTLKLQFKDAINIATSKMMFERSKKVTNIGKAKFTELVLDVFQLLTLEKLHYAIVRIIKQVTHQKGLANTKGNQRDLHIKHAIHLLCNQPSSLLDKFSTLSILQQDGCEHQDESLFLT
jgi:hypothetical protein